MSLDYLPLMNNVEMQDGYLVRFCGMGNVMGGGKGTESLIGIRRFATAEVLRSSVTLILDNSLHP